MFVLYFLLQILAGWLLADFLSGVFRWYDNRFERLPFGGPALVLLATFVIGGLLLWLLGVHAWILTAMFGCLMARSAQGWADNFRNAPAWVPPLQKLRLLKHPFQQLDAPEREWCMLTGWLNPVLKLVGFWYWLDKLTKAK